MYAAASFSAALYMIHYVVPEIYAYIYIMFYALLYAIASPKEDGYNIIIKCGQIFPRLHRALEFCGLIMLRVDVLVAVVVVVGFCYFWCNFFRQNLCPWTCEVQRSPYEVYDRITACYALAHDNILFNANDKARLRDSYDLSILL